MTELHERARQLAEQCTSYAAGLSYNDQKAAPVKHTLHEAAMMIRALLEQQRSPTNETIATAARALVARAERLGMVLTVEQRPRQPLAMGNYETVVSVRPARVQS